MKKIALIVISVFLIAITVTGCGRKAASSKDVLATVGNEAITLDGFNEKIAQLPPNVKSIAESNKLGYLDNLVLETLFYQEVLRRKIDKDKEIQKLFEEAKKKIMIARLVKEEIEDKISISDEEIRDYSPHL